MIYIVYRNLQRELQFHFVKADNKISDTIFFVLFRNEKSHNRTIMAPVNDYVCTNEHKLQIQKENKQKKTKICL